MRILVATGLYPPEIGGPATYARLLETELPGRNIEVTVLPFSRVRHLPKGVRHLVYALLLFRAARRVRMIYALDPVSVGVPALCVARTLDLLFVLRVAGDYAWEQARLRQGTTVSLEVFQEDWQQQPFSVRLLRWIEVWVTRSASCVVVPSRYLAEIVGGWGVSESRLRVINSTFEEPKVKVSRDEVRARFGLSGFVIVSAGRLVPWKGFDGLIDAIAKLPEECTLTIAGDGPLRARLEERVAVAGLAHRVRFLERLPQQELHELIAAADVFALNTGYEGLSHVLLEAMALGVPVVTTPAGGNAELVEDGESGILCAMGDVEAFATALKELFRDPELQRRYIAGGYRAVSRFTKGPAFDALASMFRELEQKT